MLKNYFIIAMAVLKRRKFFTFISLFGIAFTLMVLVVATSFVDNITGSTYPEVNRNRSIYILNVEQRNSEKGYTMNGPLSLSYFNKYVATLKTPEKISMSSVFRSTNTYVNNKKLVIDMNFTNEVFWEVMQFQFVEGKPYTKQQIANNEKVAVITEQTRQDYFGDLASVVGKYIEADNVKYRVLGVVKNVPVTMLLSYGDMYVPYTASKGDLRTQDYGGSFMAVLLARSKGDIEKVKAEYAGVVAKVPARNKDFDKIISRGDTFLFTLLGNTPFAGKDGSSKIALYSIVFLFALLFMLLPTLNLVNINISRIMERSSEIGVRKAFGASSGTLVGQFLVENMILTLVGAIVGIVLSFFMLQYINSSGLIPHIRLTINGTVLLYGLAACVIFGLLSGVLPAWRMSRLHVVKALKA